MALQSHIRSCSLRSHPQLRCFSNGFLFPSAVESSRCALRRVLRIAVANDVSLWRRWGVSVHCPAERAAATRMQHMVSFRALGFSTLAVQRCSPKYFRALCLPACIYSRAMTVASRAFFVGLLATVGVEGVTADPFFPAGSDALLQVLAAVISVFCTLLSLCNALHVQECLMRQQLRR